MKSKYMIKNREKGIKEEKQIILPKSSSEQHVQTPNKK